jgi:hypothetical protein
VRDQVKRAAILAGVLALATIAVCRGEDTGYHVKAVLVRSAEKRMEGQFVEVPKDLRIVCEGDTAGLSEGDYVKVEWRNGVATVKKMECKSMVWIH